MKKVLVSAYIGFNNFGDEAIFYALSKHLKAHGYDVMALCNNERKTKYCYDVKTCYYKNYFKVIKEIFNTDILISGGGSLLQNKTSNFSLLYYLFIIFFAKLCFKKVIIFSQGIEKIRGDFFEFLTKIILKTVDFISVRDYKSEKYLKLLGINSFVTSDPIYSILEEKTICTKKKNLLVQLRDFRGLDKRFIDDLANIISKYYKEKNGKIEVFCFQNEIDESICSKFILKLNRNNIFEVKLIKNKNISETIDKINNARFVISTRLHGLICAQYLQSKTFALIYDDKIKTLADELEIPNIDIMNYDLEQLEEKLKDFFESDNKQSYHEPRKFDWSFLDNALKNTNKPNIEE